MKMATLYVYRVRVNTLSRQKRYPHPTLFSQNSAMCLSFTQYSILFYILKLDFHSCVTCSRALF